MENSIIICRIELFLLFYTKFFEFLRKNQTMKKTEIISILCELHKISGLRVSLHGIDFEEIAAYPPHPLPFCALVNEDKREHSLCLECDRCACTEAISKKNTHIYKCRYGLTEAVSPLYNFNSNFFNSIMGIDILFSYNDYRY